MKKEFNISEAGDFLTVNDIREYLNISRSQAYELTHRRDFPVTHIGGCIRIPKEAFIVWLSLMTTIPKEVSHAMSAA